ncbi:MAG: response regulator [candidate division Zixibacteria bacterium]|nr:response regulator [candidate division Zixibacteria bacterium]
MAKMLSEHEVDVAASGPEGIRLFNERRHHQVFTDIGLPGLSGWNVAHVVRQTDPAAFIVAITGWGQYFAHSNRQISDVDEFLAKPFKMQELKNMVDKGITLRATRTATA